MMQKRTDFPRKNKFSISRASFEVTFHSLAHWLCVCLRVCSPDQSTDYVNDEPTKLLQSNERRKRKKNTTINVFVEWEK